MVVVAEAAAVEMEETRGREIFYAGRIHIDFACGGPVQVSAAVLLLLPPAERANPPSLGPAGEIVPSSHSDGIK